jgi:hypothetical protein
LNVDDYTFAEPIEEKSIVSSGLETRSKEHGGHTQAFTQREAKHMQIITKTKRNMRSMAMTTFGPACFIVGWL